MTDNPPIHVHDQPCLWLEASIVQRHGEETLQIAYEGKPLIEHSSLVENGLRELSEYEVRVPDFFHEGQCYRVTVLTVRSDGSLQPWPRDQQGSVSARIPRPPQGFVDHFFVVVAAREDGGRVHADPYPGTRSMTMLTTGGG